MGRASYQPERRGQPVHGILFAAQTRSAMSILVVEDNPLSRTVLETHLTRQGWTVLHATNGRSALETLATAPDVDLVITDIQMPEMDGLEMISAIRARPEWRAMPVLVATAQANAELVRRAAALGVRHLAVKPFNFTQLVQQVREVLRAELPTLRAPKQVQLTLGVNETAYRTLLQGFDELVAARLLELAALAAGDGPRADGVDVGLTELRESATLVGADRVVSVIDAMRAELRGTPPDAASLAPLVRELERVRAALRRAAPAAPTEQPPVDAPAPTD
jgi:CheY-like chemotaxis protein